MEVRVQRSLSELAAPLRDVSRWNRLLSLPSDRRSGYLSFVEPACAVRDALSSGERVALREPVLALRDDWSSAAPGLLGAEEAARRLRRLDDLARDIDEETGVSPLMLGLGLVLWRDGERVRVAPLMLCPVVLDGLPEAPSLRRAGVPVGNPVLFDRLGIDPDRLRPDPLTWTAEDLAGHGVVSVTPVAVLGLFDVVRYRQWQRLDARRDPRLVRDPRILGLLSGGREGSWRQLAEPTSAGATRMVASLDRSQELVVQASRAGLDLVVQGGPGTGKTQAIVHILGNALRDGRTVLFLSGRQSAFRSARERLKRFVPEACWLALYGPECSTSVVAGRLGVAPGETVLDTARRATRRPPLVMATPTSYAAHLPADWIFDLLVVDEASLVPLAEALPAVAACRQIVICGDSQQMQKDPPLWVLFDPDNPYVPAPTLLDAAEAAGAPRTRLTHHYRSLHPTLMHYTNRMFHRGLMRMSVSPVADRERGLRLVTLDGTFDGRALTNAAEAEAVIDELARHVATGSTASVGVIAMTMQQRDLIRRRIAERGLDLEPVSRTAPVLVADYNGVQGEERDVILISLTFGRRPGNGAWPTSYGALSLPGGEKRLAVIMSRARERMVVFASFPAESIDASLAAGHSALLTYLMSAARQHEDDPRPYKGVLSGVLDRNSWQGFDLGNAIKVVSGRTGRTLAAIYVTGVIDALTERSEIAQYRNAGWLVLEVDIAEAEAAAADDKHLAALCSRLWRQQRTPVAT